MLFEDIPVPKCIISIEESEASRNGYLLECIANIPFGFIYIFIAKLSNFPIKVLNLNKCMANLKCIKGIIGEEFFRKFP